MHNVLIKINNHINENTENATYQIIPFGILGFFTFPLFYFLVSTNIPGQYENLFLRIIASILCLPLILKEYWPLKFKKYLPFYWYIVILYTLPFFFIFMMLKNDFSQVWLMNAMQLIFFLIVIVDWLSFIMLIILGSIIAYFTFLISGGVLPITFYFSGEIVSLIVAIFIGTFFSRSKSKLETEKFEALKALGSTIAHELRTPLTAIRSGVEGIKAYLPGLIETYKVANEQKLATKHIRNDQLISLEKSVDNVEAETNLANITINMLLTNTRQTKLTQNEVSIFSAQDLITEALERYPMQQEQKTLIHLNPEHNFMIQGDKELITHLLFNLLKNALYYLAASQKGEINIRFEPGEKFDSIYFKDTGQGIAPEDLPHIFDRFFSRTYHGSGIGLAFCKSVMKLHKGSITCQSQFGEYAEFIIRFPKFEAHA